MGGGGRGYLFKLVLGRGGQVFWVDQTAPSKKIKTSTIWKDFCDKRLPQNLLWGGKPNNTPPPPPPPHAENEIPPPTHTRKKWHGPRVRGEKNCPHKNTPIGETPPPPPRWIFFIHVSPTWRAPISPLACADHDL